MYNISFVILTFYVKLKTRNTVCGTPIGAVTVCTKCILMNSIFILIKPALWNFPLTVE